MLGYGEGDKGLMGHRREFEAASPEESPSSSSPPHTLRRYLRGVTLFLDQTRTDSPSKFSRAVSGEEKTPLGSFGPDSFQLKTICQSGMIWGTCPEHHQLQPFILSGALNFQVWKQALNLQISMFLLLLLTGYLN